MAYQIVSTSDRNKSASGMKAFLVSGSFENQYTVMLAFQPGDEVMSGIMNFAEKYNVKTASFTGIGALSHGTIAFYDPSVKSYKTIKITTQSELTSLIGNITTLDGKPMVHVHVNLSDLASGGMTRGGHALELYTMPITEIFIQVYPVTVTKTYDPNFRLAYVQ